MRIVLAHSHVNTFGGGERALLELSRHLARQHDVRLLLGGFAAQLTYAELASLPSKQFGRLQWPLARVAADAIITNSFGANLLAVRNGPRVAYWVHSTRSLFLRPDANRADLRVRRLIDWLAVRRAGQLVANSLYTANRLRQLYGRDPDAIVYPGVDSDQFRPAADPAPAQYAIVVGRLAPEKGLERLFDLWRDVPDLPLHVVGGGMPETIRALRVRAPSSVVFRGHLTGDELVAAYHGAAVAVFAPHGEEFGLAPLEAMACGVPVIAWREGGLQETVVDGQTGFLVSDEVTFRQRVRLLLHDETRRLRFGSAARQRASELSWTRTALGFEVVCQRLAAMPSK